MLLSVPWLALEVASIIPFAPATAGVFLQVPDGLVVGVPHPPRGVLLTGGGAIAVVHKEDGVGG